MSTKGNQTTATVQTSREPHPESLGKLWTECLRIFRGNYLSVNPVDLIYKSREYRLAVVHNGEKLANAKVIEAVTKFNAGEIK